MEHDSQSSDSGRHSPALPDGGERTLSWRQSFAFGIGHFFNDLCASMWFSYMLLFLKNVLMFSSQLAGVLILIGQVTDAIATPLVGLEADRRSFRMMARYGQRKSWHCIGTALVACSFPFLFIQCLGCTEQTKELSKLVYFAPFVVIFQIGWATVQISHLALIPDISNSKLDRTTLNGFRYGFTVIANLSVFLLAWFLFGTDHSHQFDVDPEDLYRFKIMGLAAVGVGLVTSVIFQLGTAESEIPPRRALLVDARDEEEDEGIGDHYSSGSYDPSQRSWKDWFGDYRFYHMALLYVCTRLFINISQVYMPLYVLETQHFQKEYIAIIPLITYSSSLVVSVLFSSKLFNFVVSRRELIYFSGSLIGLAGCAWMWFHNLHWKIFGVSVFLGVASAALLITSLAMVSDLIGPHVKSGAFVFGAMSFCDKLANGVAIQVVQTLEPVCTKSCVLKDWYYRNVMVFVPGCALLVALLALLIRIPSRPFGRIARAQHTEEVRGFEESF